MLRVSARQAALSAGIGRRAASTISLKYSQALFGAALKKSPAELDKVQSELSNITATIKATPKLGEFIDNPTLSPPERNTAIQALFKHSETAGPKKGPLSEVTKNLFIVLSDNGRLADTADVIEGFNELVATHKGELTVTITSASALPKDVQTRLESTLKQSQTAQKAKTLKVVNKVNPTILGGIVVDFGDKTIDLSVASRVSKLNNLLQESV